MAMTNATWTDDANASIPIRELALRSGEVHNELMRAMPQLSKLSQDELIQKGESDLAKLRSRERLADTETDQLFEILRLIGADASLRDKSDRIDTILQQIESSDGSPYALLIASIAAASSRRLADLAEEASPDAVPLASQGAVVAADVVGGIAGVFIGDELSGLPCGVIAGACGAAGASLAVSELL